MYKKMVPFKDFNGKPRNQAVHFNLSEREVMKNLIPLKFIFKWRDERKALDPNAEVPTEDVVEFFNVFEQLLLEAWGEPSEDGLRFSKTGRYEFEESSLFDAFMLILVTDVREVAKLLEDMLPKGMETIVKKTDANLEAYEAQLKLGEANGDKEREIADLRARLAAAESE